MLSVSWLKVFRELKETPSKRRSDDRSSQHTEWEWCVQAKRATDRGTHRRLSPEVVSRSRPCTAVPASHPWSAALWLQGVKQRGRPTWRGFPQSPATLRHPPPRGNRTFSVLTKRFLPRNAMGGQVECGPTRPLCPLQPTRAQKTLAQNTDATWKWSMKVKDKTAYGSTYVKSVLVNRSSKGHVAVAVSPTQGCAAAALSSAKMKRPLSPRFCPPDSAKSVLLCFPLLEIHKMFKYPPFF